MGERPATDKRAKRRERGSQLDLSLRTRGGSEEKEAELTAWSRSSAISIRTSVVVPISALKEAAQVPNEACMADRAWLTTETKADLSSTDPSMIVPRTPVPALIDARCSSRMASWEVSFCEGEKMAKEEERSGRERAGERARRRRHTSAFLDLKSSTLPINP